jgi:hypothetical protein
MIGWDYRKILGGLSGLGLYRGKTTLFREYLKGYQYYNLVNFLSL